MRTTAFRGVFPNMSLALGHPLPLKVTTLMPAFFEADLGALLQGRGSWEAASAIRSRWPLAVSSGIS
eukprot:3915992-Pyramimonas_sp.AAC.1